MCIVCCIEEMEDDVSDPWDELKDGILGALRESIAGFSSSLRDSIQPFLREQALKMAKEKWRAIHADTDEEREIAESNLRHLRSQVEAEVSRLGLAATSEAEKLLQKTLEVTANVLLRIGPKVLGL